MGFEQDIFVSYAHIDDEELRGKKWIAEFHRALSIRLRQLRGESSRIWRDPELQGNSFFADTIEDQLAKVALFVAIISPRYLKSEWCNRELAGFFAAAEKSGGLRIADKARLFKVVKTFVPLEDHPEALRPLLGYEFYEKDDRGRPREFDQIYGPESENKYWAKLEDLAYDINQLLEVLDEAPESSHAEPVASPLSSSSGQTIYLAETTFDLEEERHKIRREFLDKGHRVIPSESLPFAPGFTTAVEAGLAESQLAIHLVSDQSLTTSDGGSESITNLQTKLWQARCREQMTLSATRAQSGTPFLRIIWAPPSVRGQVSESAWMQALRQHPDFLAGSLEDLKTHMDHQLCVLSQPSPVLETSGYQCRIYLDCDERDLESPEIEPLYEFLEEQFEVVIPDHVGTGVIASEEAMRQCDGVLIYYGYGNGLWLKRRVRALQKTLYKRERPLLTQSVYVAAPANPNKLSLTAQAELPVIMGLDGFRPELLASFVQPLCQEVEV